MCQKITHSLTSTLILYHDLEKKNINKISTFINSQISKMPDYFSFAIKTLSILFEVIIFLTHLKRFHRLSDLKKISLIRLIKKNNIPIFSLFIRLFESNALVKYYELNNEK
jgi:hypothetical protein